MSSSQTRTAGNRLVYIVFFVSGMAAVLYQLAWQRALFVTYGTNNESITAIVAAFMLGLGLGSLFGGRLSYHTRISRVKLFAGMEACVGAYGVVSLPILHFVGESTAGVSVAASMALSFLLIVFPTVLMGGTLPILVQYLVERNLAVGEAVGELYYVNTLGSAAVCLVAGLLLFGTLGLSGAVYVAVAMNFTVAATTLSFFGEP